MGNKECNPECNTTACNYDEYEYDCLVFSGLELCDSTQDEHECDITWIDDGWCDRKCNIGQCGFDGEDCKEDVMEYVSYSSLRQIPLIKIIIYLSQKYAQDLYGDTWKSIVSMNGHSIIVVISLSNWIRMVMI